MGIGCRSRTPRGGQRAMAGTAGDQEGSQRLKGLWIKIKGVVYKRCFTKKRTQIARNSSPPLLPRCHCNASPSEFHLFRFWANQWLGLLQSKALPSSVRAETGSTRKSSLLFKLTFCYVGLKPPLYLQTSAYWISYWGLQLLIDVKAIWNIKAKAVYEEGLKKQGNLPLFLSSYVQQPWLNQLSFCEQILEGLVVTFMGWRLNTKRSLGGNTHKSPGSSELQCHLLLHTE